MKTVGGALPRFRRGRAQARTEGSRQVWRIAGVSALLALVVWALLSVNLVPRAYEVHEGEVSTTDIRSPRKLTYTSQVLTKAEKDRAAAAVQEVVEIDPTAVQRQRFGLTALLQTISTVRNTAGLAVDQKRDQLARLGQPPLEEPSITLLATLDDARWYLVASEGQRLLTDALKDKLPEWRVPEVVRPCSFISRSIASIDDGRSAERFSYPVGVITMASSRRM